MTFSSIFRGLLLSVAVGAVAAEVRVGVLPSSENKHVDDFNPQLSAIGAKVVLAQDDAEGTKKIIQNLKNFDVVMVPPLNGFKNARFKCNHEKLDAYVEPLKKWVEAGGLLYVSDANYPETLGWLKALDAGLGVGAGQCGQSGGPAKLVAPEDPILLAPNRMDPWWTWGHMDLPDEKNTGWRVVGVCNHDHPVMMTKRLGKGLIYVTSLRGQEDKLIQNFFAQRTLSEVGLEVLRTEVPDVTLGMNTVKAYVRGIGQKDVDMRVVFTVGSDTFSTNVVVKAGTEHEVVMECGVRARGKVRAEVKVGSGKAEAVCYGREFYLPEFFDIKGTSYRGGIVVPERRYDAVSVVTTLYPYDEMPEDYVVRVKATEKQGGQGKVLGEGEKTVGVGIDTVPLSFPRDVAPGEYWVQGELVKKADESVVFEKEFPLTVLSQEPGTVVADEDGVFLLEGEPYYPLGVYHADADIKKYLQVGANLFHTMKWGTPVSYCKWDTVEMGQQIFWEEKAKNDEHLDGLTKFWKDAPALFSYYLSDEPKEREYENVRADYERFVARDSRHPTFVCACYPETWKRFAWACDILGANPYPYWPAFKRDRVGCNWLPMRDASGRTRPTIAVPQAFGHEEEAPLRCMSLTAVANGVNGICWYAWQNDPASKSGARFYDESIGYLAELVANIKTIAPALMNPRERLQVYQTKQKDGTDFFWCLGTMPETGTRILVAASQSAKPVEMRLPGIVTGMRTHDVTAIGPTFGEMSVEENDIVLKMKKFGSGIWSFGGVAPVMVKKPSDYVYTNLAERASGKVWKVSAKEGAASLQTAIEKAADGDVIEVGEGEYAPIECANKVLDIVAVGAREKTILRGAKGCRAATLSLRDVGDMRAETNVVLRGFTIVGGTAGEKAIKRGGCVLGGTLEQCVVEGGVAVYGGGMAYGRALDCVFRKNRATFNGGAGVFLAAERCTFEKNEAGFDGGALEFSHPRVCVFEGNKAKRHGGAMNFGDAVSSRFVRNEAGKNGGAGMCTSFRNCLLEGNKAGEDGGAVMGGELVFSTAVKNVAGGMGGAVRGGDDYGVNVLPGEIRGSIVWGNVSKGDGNKTRSFAQMSKVENSVVEPMEGVEYKENVITEAPTFEKGYRLRADSVGVETKHWYKFGKETELDPDGKLRFSGKYADFGCYEVEVAEEKAEGK